MRIGYFLSCEEHGPRELVRQAQLAEAAGFDRVWISDHFHPWVDEQGQSPFVWSVIGALAAATERLHVTTGVTCPTVRIHPAVLAQARPRRRCCSRGASRSAWAAARRSTSTSSATTGRTPASAWRCSRRPSRSCGCCGRAATAATAGATTRWRTRASTRCPTSRRPSSSPASGRSRSPSPRASGTATAPRCPRRRFVERYRAGGGKGPAQGGVKVCWGPDEDECVETVYRLWPNEGLPGELAQILPTPRHFEQAVELVTEDMIRESVPLRPGPRRATSRRCRRTPTPASTSSTCSRSARARRSSSSVFAREVLPRFR